VVGRKWDSVVSRKIRNLHRVKQLKLEFKALEFNLEFNLQLLILLAS
jgi:hypothetical protein